MTKRLPIDAIQSEFLSAWKNYGGAIVGAPPGSGKTTQLPLWLLQEACEKIFLLIPKRIAVKLAAKQLAQNHGSELGDSIGYVLRQDRVLGANTELVVTSYGSFLRMLLNDPDSISGTTIIFDEFHERSAEQDLTYALIHQYVTELDDSVKRVVMSATLDTQHLVSHSGLPFVESEGSSFPIDTQYDPIDRKDPRQIAQKIRRTAAQTQNHTLVFCAGLKEIRALERQLSELNLLILHGNLDRTPDVGRLTEAPATIILATNIAESSVTLPRVHTVVDCGEERYAETNPVTGITSLKTRLISRASATQRAGRAGRLGPGVAIRLWSEDQHNALVSHQPPDIQSADLLPVVLKTLCWGTSLEELPWLKKPASSRWDFAIEKLERWEALKDGEVTLHGKAMEATGLEPWLAHLISLAQREDCLPPAAILAAHIVTSERIEYSLTSPARLSDFSSKVRLEADALLKRFGGRLPQSISPIDEAFLVKALPDRVIRWRDGETGQLISGTETRGSANRREQWSLMLDGIFTGSTLKVSASIGIGEDAVFEALPTQETILFQPKAKPAFIKEVRLGRIRLSELPYQPEPSEKSDAWLTWLTSHGAEWFEKDQRIKGIKARWLMANQIEPTWPAWLSNREWSAAAEPFLSSIRSLTELDGLQVLEHGLGYTPLNELEQLCPRQWTAPTGRALSIQYDAGNQSVSVEIKLQEIFGLSQQPRLSNGHPIQLALLAPNGRPVASVTDLSHFWHNVYPDVRKELRGRYAKHPWPEDPLSFTPTSKTNRQLGQSQ